MAFPTAAEARERAIRETMDAFVDGVAHTIMEAAGNGQTFVEINLGRLGETERLDLKDFLEGAGYTTHLHLPGQARDSLRIGWQR